LTPEEFKTIQKTIGFNNPRMARFLKVHVSTIEHWRGGRRNISKRMANAVRLLKVAVYFHKIGSLDLEGLSDFVDEPAQSKEGNSSRRKNCAAEQRRSDDSKTEGDRQDA